MKNRSPEEKAFLLHKSGATRGRGIDFHFTFDEWCAWWEDNLGPDWFSKRGCKLGKYVMARHNDTGPYAPWNVKCITLQENSREQYNPKKLTADQVMFIYQQVKAQPMGLMGRLAREHGVRREIIKDIRDKRIWRLITDALD